MTLRFLTAGESHGAALVTILEGLPAGLELSEDIINRELSRRQAGLGSGARMKLETDRVKILAGVMAGMTIGSPLAMMIENLDHAKWKNKEVTPFTIPRPGHADLTGTVKFGFRDLRPALERASARETAARVAVGAVCKHLLSQFGIQVGGYVVSIGAVTADITEESFEKRIALAEASDVRCPSSEESAAMRQLIEQTIQDKNTLGGVIEIIARGVPPGLGSYAQWDRRLEARMGAALLSVQAIKGVEFGDGFKLASMVGTQAQDGIYLNNGQLIRKTNHAGGLEGGITNGEPLVMRVAMKPIATTLKPQPSVDLASQKEVKTQYERSDYCPTPRAVPVLESMVAFVLAEALIEKLGGDSLTEMLPRFESMRKAGLSDLPMDNTPHIFWSEREQP
ncbi:MAG: chorismate synthase [Anaerolineales bacterium]|nr:chorismate synthase [Anaerolineales bacterium]